jgi:hypothetical protein
LHRAAGGIGRTIYRHPDMLKMRRRMYIFIGDN